MQIVDKPLLAGIALSTVSGRLTRIGMGKLGTCRH
jgi:hypothetical protein